MTKGSLNRFIDQNQLTWYKNLKLAVQITALSGCCIFILLHILNITRWVIKPQTHLLQIFTFRLKEVTNMTNQINKWSKKGWNISEIKQMKLVSMCSKQNLRLQTSISCAFFSKARLLVASLCRDTISLQDNCHQLQYGLPGKQKTEMKQAHRALEGTLNHSFSVLKYKPHKWDVWQTVPVIKAHYCVKIQF